jgi:hypothetical protein
MAWLLMAWLLMACEKPQIHNKKGRIKYINKWRMVTRPPERVQNHHIDRGYRRGDGLVTNPPQRGESVTRERNTKGKKMIHRQQPN